MANELQLWAINGAADGVARVEPRNQTETEKLLEDMLVKQPGMLMRGLKLVGRQTPAAGGFLDLLGVDADGRLIVFELKRGTLTRDAITQVIDYAADLESRELDDLYAHITERSGAYGIDHIENFEEWYLQRHGDQSLKPVRMALVALGVDDHSHRMVRFLAERGVEIDLLTFYAFDHGGETLLARHVELEYIAPERTVTRVNKAEEHTKKIAELVQDWGITFWEEALDQIRKIGTYPYIWARAGGYAFELPKLSLPRHDSSFYTCYSIRAVEGGKIRVTFFPIAVHLCSSQFDDVSKRIPFTQERPPNAPMTSEVSQQWYCVLDEAGWHQYKHELLRLTSEVYEAWDRARRGEFQNISIEDTSLRHD